MTTARSRPGDRERGAPRWLAWALVAGGIVLAPWAVYLLVTLPTRYTGHFYPVSWAGFDVALLACLVCTGIAALRDSRWTDLAAATTGTLLFVDAWFDISGAGSRPDFWTAFLLAAVVEIPLGVLCWRLALRTRRTRRPLDPV